MSIDFDFKIPFSSVLVAKRNCGKTVLCRNIIHQLMTSGKIDSVFIFSPTARASGDFDFLPDNYKYEKFEADTVQKILDFQEKTKDKTKRKQILLVLDDLIGTLKNGSIEQQMVNKLYSSARHFSVSIIALTQYPRSSICSPVIRANVDYLFISKNTNASLMIIFDFVMFDGTKKEWLEFCKNSCQNYKFLMYDNLNQEDDKRFFSVLANDKLNWDFLKTKYKK